MCVSDMCVSDIGVSDTHRCSWRCGRLMPMFMQMFMIILMACTVIILIVCVVMMLIAHLRGLVLMCCADVL